MRHGEIILRWCNLTNYDYPSTNQRHPSHVTPKTTTSIENSAAKIRSTSFHPGNTSCIYEYKIISYNFQALQLKKKKHLYFPFAADSTWILGVLTSERTN